MKLKKLAGGIFIFITTASIIFSAQKGVCQTTDSTLTAANLERQADSLYRTYNFSRAGSMYRNLIKMEEDASVRSRLEIKTIACDNGAAMLEFVSTPAIVTRRTLDKRDFYLYYPDARFTYGEMGLGRVDTLYHPDGANVLYFSSQAEGGNWNIYVTKYSQDGVWSAPKVLNSNITTSGNEIFPFLSPDGEHLYFASDGHPGAGGYDLYVSEWNKRLGDWGPAQNLGFPYSSPADDYFFYITPDGKYATFSSTRNFNAPASRIQDNGRITTYVVHFEPNPIKKSMSPQEAAATARLSQLAGTTDRQRDSLRNASVNKALEGVDAQTVNTPKDSATTATTAYYSRITQQHRVLQKQMRDMEASQKKQRELYSSLEYRIAELQQSVNLTLTDSLLAAGRQEALLSKQDSLAALVRTISEQEEQMFALQEELNRVDAEIMRVEAEFLQGGMVVPTADTAATSSPEKSNNKNTSGTENMLESKNPLIPLNGFKIEQAVVQKDFRFKIGKQGWLADLEDFPDGVVYQIRISSNISKSNATAFKGLSPVFERKSNGRFIYSVGVFSTYAEAARNLPAVKRLGFTGAIIVAYKDGKAISIANARKMEGEGTAYNVVISGYDGALPEAVLTAIRSTGKDIARTSTSEGYRYIVGTFGSQSEANALASSLQAISDKEITVEPTGK